MSLFAARAGARAGEGNRTLVFSLEGYGSTIELHPQCGHLTMVPASGRAGVVAWWKVGSMSLGADSPRKRVRAAWREVSVGGTGFEPVKAVPSDLQSDPFDRSGNPPRLPPNPSTHSIRAVVPRCPRRRVCQSTNAPLAENIHRGTCPSWKRIDWSLPSHSHPRRQASGGT